MTTDPVVDANTVVWWAVIGVVVALATIVLREALGLPVALAVALLVGVVVGAVRRWRNRR